MTPAIAYLAIFIIFLVKSILLLDPDFGWHLRMGEVILNQGIPSTDPLSYTMKSFPFVDHEWLTNVFIFLLYISGGPILLSIIFSLLVVFVLYLNFGKLEKPGVLVAFLLVSGILLSFSGVRTQVLSWVLVAIFLKVLLEERFWNRFKFFIPIILLIWTNMHGSFAIGVVFLLLFGLIRFFQKKLHFSDCGVILISIGATFINPYKERIWEEVFRQFFDTNLKNEIAEWAPGIFFYDLAFWALFLVTSALIFYDLRAKFEKFRLKVRKITPAEQLRLVFFVVLIGAGLSAYRHIPFWAILAGPLLVIYFANFRERLKNDSYARFVIPKIVKFTTILTGIVFVLEIGINYYTAYKYSENYFYPDKAISFLKANLSEGEIFSFYSWGGYLDWKLPEKRIFIDGRMPSWRWEAPVGESDWALGDHIEIVNFADPDQYFQKYNIDTIVWPVFRKQHPLLSMQGKVVNSIGKSLGVSSENPSETFVTKLQDSGWKIVYQDEKSVVLKD